MKTAKVQVLLVGDHPGCFPPGVDTWRRTGATASLPNANEKSGTFWSTVSLTSYLACTSLYCSLEGQSRGCRVCDSSRRLRKSNCFPDSQPSLHVLPTFSGGLDAGSPRGCRTKDLFDPRGEHVRYALLD